MTFKLLLHPSEEGGFWAEVLNLPGCFTQGTTVEEVKENAREAILSHIGVMDADAKIEEGAQVLEIAV